MVEIHQDEALAPAGRLALIIFSLASAPRGLLALGVFILARQIARPILAITRHRHPRWLPAISPSVRLCSPTTRCGVLARAFNTMTEQLRTLYDTLEDQVVDRTAELQRAKEYFESLVQNSPVAIMTQDLDSTVDFVESGRREVVRLYRRRSRRSQLDTLVASDELSARSGSLLSGGAARGTDHALARRTRKDGSTCRRRAVVRPGRSRRPARRDTSWSTTM